jgi:hypothetical protein
MPKQPPKALATLSGKSLHVEVEDALLFLAWLSWPPTHIGSSLAECWAWQRYLPAIAPTSDLRLRPEWKDLDAHQKVLLSDDFGVCFSASILTDVLEFVEFADTNWALRMAYRGAYSLKGKKKRGPRKSPDFLIVDVAGQVSFLECKGTQTSQVSLRNAISKGVEQKRNVEAHGARPKHLLSAGLFIPVGDYHEPAVFVVSDPEIDELERAFRAVPLSRLVAAIRRISLAKQLAAAGYQRAAAVLFDPAVTESRAVRTAIQTDFADLAADVIADDPGTRRFEGAVARERSHRFVEHSEATTDLVESVFRATVPFNFGRFFSGHSTIEEAILKIQEESSGEWRRSSEGSNRILMSPTGIQFILMRRVTPFHYEDPTVQPKE